MSWVRCLLITIWCFLQYCMILWQSCWLYQDKAILRTDLNSNLMRKPINNFFNIDRKFPLSSYQNGGIGGEHAMCILPYCVTLGDRMRWIKQHLCGPYKEEGHIYTARYIFYYKINSCSNYFLRSFCQQYYKYEFI